MKRVFEEEVLFPVVVPDEVFDILLRKTFSRYESERYDYCLLMRWKTVSKNMKQMIEALMREAERLPLRIESKINSANLLEKHHKIKKLSHSFNYSDVVRQLRELRTVSYPDDFKSTPHEPFLSKDIQKLDIYGRDDSSVEIPHEILQSVRKVVSHASYWECYELLPKFVNLTTLKTFHRDSFQNTDLQKLTNLTKLSIIMNCSLTDDAFRFSSNLKYLSLQYQHGITDYALISYLPQLEYLHCNSQITNTSVSRLTNLKSLLIQGTSSDPVFSFHLLTNLTHLHTANAIPYNDDWNLLPLSLTCLNLSYSCVPIHDQNLKRLTNLKTLHLHNNSATTSKNLIIIDEPLDMPSLTSLYLHGNTTIIDRHIEKLTNLTSLDLYNNHKITHSVFRGLTNIRSLMFSDGVEYHYLKHLPFLTDVSSHDTCPFFERRNFPPHIYLSEEWS